MIFIKELYSMEVKKKGGSSPFFFKQIIIYKYQL
nr:MAG TPA: hypothetical protein [Caudoviricetes sp.]